MARTGDRRLDELQIRRPRVLNDRNEDPDITFQQRSSFFLALSNPSKGIITRDISMFALFAFGDIHINFTYEVYTNLKIVSGLCHFV